MPLEVNYYAYLGIPFDATSEEVRHAYRTAALRLHPDTNVRPGDTELYLKVQEAFEVLSDPQRRKRYDDSLPEEFSDPVPLTINVQYSRSSLQQLNEPQLIYVLLILEAQAVSDTHGGPPLNLCLALDCSTSMRGKYLDTVKATALTLIHQMRPQDRLSLVTFNDRANVLIPAGSHSDPGRIDSIIRSLQACGGTEIFKGLEAGYNEVFHQMRGDSINHIILLTDGRTYGDEEDCLQIAGQCATYGIGISTLGIGTKWNDVFLDNLASITGGSSKFVTEPDEIQKYLIDKFSGLGRNYADQVAFSFEPGIGVELRYAFRLQPEATQLEVDSPVQLGSLPEKSSMRVLFEFYVSAVPNYHSQTTVAEGNLKFNIPSRPIPIYNTRIKLDRPNSLHPDSSPPPIAILEAMSKITLYRMHDRAQQDMNSGDYASATHRLELLASNLLSRGERDLADAVLDEVGYVLQNQRSSEAGNKHIKYGTRDLFMPPSQRNNERV